MDGPHGGEDTLPRASKGVLQYTFEENRGRKRAFELQSPSPLFSFFSTGGYTLAVHMVQPLFFALHFSVAPAWGCARVRSRSLSVPRGFAPHERARVSSAEIRVVTVSVDSTVVSIDYQYKYTAVCAERAVTSLTSANWISSH